MNKLLVCTDRDGTLIYDEKYHLGRTSDWKSKVRILPTVIKGLKSLKSIPNTLIYMITNQPGVAINDFPLLTLEKAHEVSQHIVEIIKNEGGLIDGYFICPHATHAYVTKRSNYEFDKKMICDCECAKPRPGMVFDVLKKEDLSRDDVDIYVIGDRSSDVQTAINADGIGILIPFENEAGEIEQVKNMNNPKTYIAKNFFDAAQFIIRDYHGKIL
ncbi:MAG: HAD-IIIA family hydrolase [Candidatus Bathyarchaeota archaeon]|nr:HAD-IIIA family hydrolase [Candidatus Bathyarchaeota archaeon]